MKKEIQNLSSEEILELIDSIARPTFKYMMKRVSHQIMEKKDHEEMSVDTFISILIAAIAPVNVNLIKWISNFYTIKTGKNIDADRLMNGLIGQINSQLGIVLH